MKLKFVAFIICIGATLNAFSTTNVQLLYGEFDGNSYIYDTKNAKKTTITVEHFVANEIGSIFAFFDYAIADGRFKYHDDRHDLYGEIAPRLNLNNLVDLDLSRSFISNVYLVAEYNRGQTTDYTAYLYGLGVDLQLYGFDNFSLNFYSKQQNVGKNTIQLTGIYKAQIPKSNFHFTGYFDWTELDFTTQNQFLYNFYSTSNFQKAYVGVEWLIYNEKPSVLNYNTNVNTNVMQVMLKYEW